MKKDKGFIKKVIAIILSMTGMITSFVGCGNESSEKEESTNIVQTTQEETTQLDSKGTYFDILNEKDKNNIKTLFKGLHIPEEYIKNDTLIMEIDNFISLNELLNENYIDNIEFVCSLAYDETRYYYTKDENILYREKDKQIYIKCIDATIKRMYAFDNDVWESTHYTINGNLISNTMISKYGLIGMEDYQIKYSEVITDNSKERCRFFSNYEDNNYHLSLLPFINGRNVVKISYDYNINIKTHERSLESINCNMFVSDEEMNELIDYYDNRDHIELQKLAKKLEIKYADQYNETYNCYKHEITTPYYHETTIKLGTTQDGIKLDAHVYSPAANPILIDCKITEEEKLELLFYIKNRDCAQLISYIEELDKKYSIYEDATTDYAKTYSMN